MNRRDFLCGTAATAVAAALPATVEPQCWQIRYTPYAGATERLAASFMQMKEIVAANILNGHPLLGQMKWDGGKQWCWDGERWIDDHQVWRIQDDDEP